MVRRKGMAKGTGKGYKNLMGSDSRVHSLSARGVKQPQRIKPILNKVPKKKTTNWLSVTNDYQDRLRDYGEGQDYFDWVEKSNNGNKELMASEYQDKLRNYGESEETFKFVVGQNIN